MQAEALSHTGLVRPGNEDYYIVNMEKGLFAVADGMGGHQAGEIASHLALEALAEKLFSDSSGDPLSRILAASTFANEVVYRSSLSSQDRNGMGTTLTVFWVNGNKGYLTHIGDSRAYLFRNGQLKVLTNDHSYVGELVRNGEITIEEARQHPYRNILTRALGTNSVAEIDTWEMDLFEGDCLLLCTDGLYEVIEDDELAMILSRYQDLAKATRELINLALARGGPDNITVVLVRYE
ncbi:MAG: family protein phosphatase [Clostridia bacterium]|nr:family protein phosphatase [Clostridia bacterium]